jgi:signal transduction histidine kinase
MTSLHFKFLGLIGVLLSVAGALFFYVQGRSFELYETGMNQALNERLASTLVAERFTDAPDSVAATKQAFSELMTINPGIQLYLVGPDGAIEAFTAPPDQVLRRTIDVAPLNTFIRGGAAYPLLGDDPKTLNDRWIFSAAPIDSRHPERGVLYVVLRGPQYEVAARRTDGRKIYHDGLIVMAIGLGAAGAVSATIVFGISRRLRRLMEAMEAFRGSDFTESVPVLARNGADGDEIDRLAETYNAMALHIRDQVDQLRRTEIMRRDLIASVSHDLRTPLAALRGYLETLMLKDEALSPRDRLGYLKIALRQSEQLQALITELFELVKLEGGETKINPEPFQVSELVQDVVQKFEVPAQNNGIALAGEIVPGAPFVYGDVALIERALENLLDNAIRHTPSGGRISLTVAPKPGAVAVEIRDTGTGIPARDIPHIFDRFYRVDKSRNQDSGGAGLGLAIVKRIVDMHSGQIDVSSRLGSGTCFVIRLPLAPGQGVRLAAGGTR